MSSHDINWEKKKNPAVLERLICFFCVVINILPNILQRTDVSPFQAMDRMMLNMRNSMQELQRNFVSTKKLMRTFSVIVLVAFKLFFFFLTVVHSGWKNILHHDPVHNACVLYKHTWNKVSWENDHIIYNVCWYFLFYFLFYKCWSQPPNWFHNIQVWRK